MAAGMLSPVTERMAAGSAGARAGHVATYAAVAAPTCPQGPDRDRSTGRETRLRGNPRGKGGLGIGELTLKIFLQNRLLMMSLMGHPHHDSGVKGAAKRGLGPHDAKGRAMGRSVMKFHRRETGVVTPASVLAVTRTATTRGR